MSERATATAAAQSKSGAAPRGAGKRHTHKRAAFAPFFVPSGPSFPLSLANTHSKETRDKAAWAFATGGWFFRGRRHQPPSVSFSLHARAWPLALHAHGRVRLHATIVSLAKHRCGATRARTRARTTEKTGLDLTSCSRDRGRFFFAARACSAGAPCGPFVSRRHLGAPLHAPHWLRHLAKANAAPVICQNSRKKNTQKTDARARAPPQSGAPATSRPTQTQARAHPPPNKAKR